jgi:hypothetical protein
MEATPGTASADARRGGATVSPQSASPRGVSHVLQAQQALQRGLLALTSLGSDASDSDAAQALLEAAQHIRTVAEQQASAEGFVAEEDMFGGAQEPVSPGGWLMRPADATPASAPVLRLFDRPHAVDTQLRVGADGLALDWGARVQASAEALRAVALTPTLESWEASAHALAEVEGVARVARARVQSAARAAEHARATGVVAQQAAAAHAAEGDAAAQAIAAAMRAAERAASSAAAASPQAALPATPLAAQTPLLLTANTAELAALAHAARDEAASLRVELAQERQRSISGAAAMPSPSGSQELLEPAAATAAARADAAVSAERARAAALEAALSAARRREEQLYAALQLAYEEAEALQEALHAERARAAELGSALAAAGEKLPVGDLAPQAAGSRLPPVGTRGGSVGSSGASPRDGGPGGARPTLRGVAALVTAASRAAAATGGARATSPRKPAVPRFGSTSRPQSRADI